MNEVPKQQKDKVLKSLAIAGFIGIIVLLAWLAIQFVNIIPGAFSSLASLAEGVGQYQSADSAEDEPMTFIVTSDATLINAGGQAIISWDTANTPGSYTFTYECVDGVAVDLLDVDGLRSIACATNYNIGDRNSLTISVDSEKNRYADVPYTVAFLGTNDTSPKATGTAQITVLNSSITDTVADNTAPNSEEAVNAEPTEPDAIEPTQGATTSPETTEPDDSFATNEPTPTPQYEQEYVYAIPSSDPNGRTDLAIRFLAVGVIEGGSFFPSAIMNDETSAIQFEVKNYGTKTSAEWDFTIEMPSGDTYESNEMDPLKPNERAVLSIGFTPAAVTSHQFVGEIDTVGDRNTLNDRFVETVVLQN